MGSQINNPQINVLIICIKNKTLKIKYTKVKEKNNKINKLKRLQKI